MKKTKNIKSITLAFLAFFSISAAANIETRELKNHCDNKLNTTVTIERTSNSYVLVLSYDTESYSKFTPFGETVFLRGDSFGFHFQVKDWTFAPYKPKATYHLENDAVRFICNNSHVGTSRNMTINIDADTYELLAKQKWLSKEEIRKH